MKIQHKHMTIEVTLERYTYLATVQGTAEGSTPIQGFGSTAMDALRSLADILDGGSSTDVERKEKSGTANDRQVGGGHYKVMKIEHWDYAFFNGLDYFQGQITKYVSRWKLKNGLQDLIKAQHFLEKYIEVVRENPEDEG